MLEANKIYCGDNLHFFEMLPENSIDLVVTSPPYDGLRIYTGYYFNFNPVAQQLFRVLKKGGIVVWVVGDQTKNYSESGTSFKQALYFKELGFNLYDTMIYRKINRFPLNHLRYTQEFEYMFIFSKGKPKTINLLQELCKFAGKINTGTARHSPSDPLSKKHGAGKLYKETKPRGNIWQYSVGKKIDGNICHPAVFPLDLAKDHILSWSNPGDLVLDPFSGSGTTLLAAKELGRNYLGFEISREYCNLAEYRISKG